MSVTLTHAAHYQLTVNAVIAALGADAQRGLSQSEAQKRLEQFGRNEIRLNYKRSRRTLSHRGIWMRIAQRGA